MNLNIKEKIDKLLREVNSNNGLNKILEKLSDQNIGVK
jgi:hypothetical protein